MNDPLRIVLVAGARPNFMKIAPLIRAIQAHNARLGGSVSADREAGSWELGAGEGTSASPQLPTPNSQLPIPISYRLVHTGQHYDDKMSDVFFRELGIPAPDVNLEVGSGSHAVQTARIMESFEPVLLGAFAAEVRGQRSEVRGQKSAGMEAGGKAGVPNRSLAPSSQLPAPTPSSQLPAPNSQLPDWLVVVGDVNSTMACTLVASKLGVKVAHVEAGLRSFDRSMPEEINRLVTDALADLLLTPSEDANENLRKEGVPDHKIRLVGNIMIDSLVANLEKSRQSQVLTRCAVEPHQFAYVTLHRPSNVDHPDSLAAIVAELKQLSRQLPVIFPIHPRTRKMAATHGIDLAGSNGLQLLDPIGYHDSLCLAENARLVLTDSGGLQEETTYFRTPCLTLRPNTERPVTITQGSNRLTSAERLAHDLDSVMRSDRRTGHVPPLWDGCTAERVLDCLCRVTPFAT